MSNLFFENSRSVKRGFPYPENETNVRGTDTAKEASMGLNYEKERHVAKVGAEPAERKKCAGPPDPDGSP
jgi:hypothetical protein